METGKSDNKGKAAVLIYEFIGTAIIMYALCIYNGALAPTLGVILVMQLLAWDISGGHFNPAITMGVFVSQKKWGDQWLLMLLMSVAQYAGACFGILLGYLALIDKQYQKDQLRRDEDLNANVPETWMGIIAPV